MTHNFEIIQYCTIPNYLIHPITVILANNGVPEEIDTPTHQEFMLNNHFITITFRNRHILKSVHDKPYQTKPHVQNHTSTISTSIAKAENVLALQLIIRISEKSIL